MSLFGDQRKIQLGVTLLELLVVMALATALLALVFPSAGAGLRTLELRSAAQRLASAARYAREQAVYQKRLFEIEINAESGTVSLTDVQRGTRQSFQLPPSVRVERILPEESGSASPSRTFLFAPEGEAPAFEIVLGTQSRQMSIKSDALTGYPKVSEL